MIKLKGFGRRLSIPVDLLFNYFRGRLSKNTKNVIKDTTRVLPNKSVNINATMTFPVRSVAFN
jgi:hypothetical protein